MEKPSKLTEIKKALKNKTGKELANTRVKNSVDKPVLK